MTRVTVNLDRRSYRILGRVQNYIAETTGERISIPELIKFHFAALFADEDSDNDLALLGEPA